MSAETTNRSITRTATAAMAVVISLVLAACGGGLEVAVQVTEDATPEPTVIPDGTDEATPDESAEPTATPAPEDATPTPGTPDPTATPEPAGEGEELDCAWPGDPIISGGFPNYSSNDSLLVDARLAGQGAYDRFVLELDGDAGAPTDSYVVSWTATPPAADGSGEPVVPDGDWYLEIRATANLYDFETDTPYAGPTSLTADTDNIREALSGGGFEGYMLWVIGADAPKGFRVQEATDPSRLIIDVCVGGIDWPSAPVDALCGEADPLPGDAVTGTTVSIDMDGDGIDEDAFTWFSPSESAWHLRVVTPVSSFDDLIVDSDGVFEAAPLGGLQMNGIGGDELFVRTTGGASTQTVGVYTLAGCELVRTTYVGSGEPAGWLEGGTVANISAFDCDSDEGTIAQRFASVAGLTDEGEPVGWDVTVDVHALTGSEWSPRPGPPDMGVPGAEPPFFAEMSCALS